MVSGEGLQDPLRLAAIESATLRVRLSVLFVSVSPRAAADAKRFYPRAEFYE
jgi:hypothetical protein